MHNRHRRGLRRALLEAEASTHPHHHLGAVVMRGGAVLSAAANHATWGKHAERRALRPHRCFEGAVIYVVRVGGGCSKPCPECLQAIRDSGISQIIFVDENRQLQETQP